jgi:MinD-like ATPase involved in chromosome partitioning or flagellar assembly
MANLLEQAVRPSHLSLVEDPQTKEKQPAFPIPVFSLLSSQGSPGRSVIALNLATEFALAGQRTLLIDLDTLAPSLSFYLGLTDSPPGLSSLLRLVDQNRLSRNDFSRLTIRFEIGRSELTFIPGISSALRWSEVTLERTYRLLEAIQSQFDAVVVDLPAVSFGHGKLVHPSVQMGRDELIFGVLEASEAVISVTGADPIAAKRFLDLQSLITDYSTIRKQFLVVNRFRTSVLGSSAKNELEQTFARFLNLRVDSFIPDEPENFDRALRNGIPLGLLKRSSNARLAIRDLANQLRIDSALVQTG